MYVSRARILPSSPRFGFRGKSGSMAFRGEEGVSQDRQQDDGGDVLNQAWAHVMHRGDATPTLMLGMMESSRRPAAEGAAGDRQKIENRGAPAERVPDRGQSGGVGRRTGHEEDQGGPGTEAFEDQRRRHRHGGRGAHVHRDANHHHHQHGGQTLAQSAGEEIVRHDASRSAPRSPGRPAAACRYRAAGRRSRTSCR